VTALLQAGAKQSGNRQGKSPSDIANDADIAKAIKAAAP